jgi:hypothetical protein
MNENNSITEQLSETEEFRLPQKSLKEKIKYAYGYNFRGSFLFMFNIFLLCGIFIRMIYILLAQLSNVLLHNMTSQTFVFTSIEPKIALISEILLFIFIAVFIYADCIRSNDRIDKNFEECVNYLRNQHLGEQDEINTISTKGEE